MACRGKEIASSIPNCVFWKPIFHRTYMYMKCACTGTHIMYSVIFSDAYYRRNLLDKLTRHCQNMTMTIWTAEEKQNIPVCVLCKTSMSYSRSVTYIWKTPGICPHLKKILEMAFLCRDLYVHSPGPNSPYIG